MKFFLFLVFLAGLYLYSLLHLSDLALNQVQHINTTYQYVANHANAIAAGQPVTVTP